MPWKVDEESGALVVDDETKNPVWVGEDGKEIPFDADRSLKKINELNTESAGRRKALQDAQGKLKLLEGIDNPEEYLSHAREALEKVKSLDESKLIDAGKVEELKAQIRDAYEGKLKEVDKARQEAEHRLSERESQISKYMIGREISASEFLKEQTVWTDDVFQARYEDHFKEEDGRIVPHWPDTGEPIYSDTRPGEVATVDEAIAKIINKRPDKDKILRSVGATGVGTEGNRTGKPASRWGHIKSRKDFKSDTEKTDFIGEVGVEKFVALPAE